MKKSIGTMEKFDCDERKVLKGGNYMIVSDCKRIIETPGEFDIDNAFIGWCDTTGSFINYVDTKELEKLEVIKEYKPIPEEKWYENE